MLSEELGCCIVSKTGDKCLNNYPASACLPEFFKSSSDCSQVNSCQIGCCKDSCSETFAYECPSDFDPSVDSCDEVEYCRPTCYYFSNDGCYNLIPCYGTSNYCVDVRFPQQNNFDQCLIDNTKDGFECVSEIPKFATRYSISGTVVDSESGLPINHAVVYVSSGITNFTDARGNFILSNVPSGSYKVYANKLGYYEYASENLDVVDDLTVNAELDSKNVVVIQGYVKSGSAALPGVTLKVANSRNSYFFVTDSKGYFEYADIESGTYDSVYVYYNGTDSYPAEPSPFVVPEFSENTKIIEQDFVIGTGVGSSVSVGEFTLSGHVNTSDGEPVVGSNVMLLYKETGLPVNGMQAVTDSSGDYVISNVPSGNYYMYASADGYVSKTSPVFYLYEDSSLHFTLVKTMKETVDANNRGNLTVYVKGCDLAGCTKGSDPYALEGADVFLYVVVQTAGGEKVRFGYNIPVKTDSQGRAVFENIAIDQSYEIEAKRLYFGPDGTSNVKQNIAFNGLRSITIGSSSSSDKTLYLLRQPVYRVTGVVKDCSGDSDVPLQDFLVYLPDAGIAANAVTLANGEYVVTNVPAGSFTIEASDKNPESRPVSYVKYSNAFNVNSENCAGGDCVVDICVERITCSEGLIRTASQFKPDLGSEVGHNVGMPPELDLTITSAENPENCNLMESRVYYCNDCVYDDDGNVLTEDLEINSLSSPSIFESAEEFSKTDFETRSELFFNANSYDESSTFEFGAVEEKNYCFMVAHFYEADNGAIVPRLSDIVCTYSGIKPCLQGKPEFCFSDDVAPGEKYSYSMADSFFTGVCEENMSTYTFTECEPGKKCYVDSMGKASCVYENMCLNCSSTLGVFTFNAEIYDLDKTEPVNCNTEPGYKDVCFTDRNYLSTKGSSRVGENDFISAVDVYKSCNMVNSCYDYKSAESCVENKCLFNRGIDCSWNPSDFSVFGDGVCTPVEEEWQDCTKCHDPTNRFFGLCDEDRCDLFGNCYYKYTPDVNQVDGDYLGKERTREINYQCINARDVACEDYNNQLDCEDGSYTVIQPTYDKSGIELGSFSSVGQDNSKLSTSNDKFELGTCRWVSSKRPDLPYFDGSSGVCIKDADYTNQPKDSEIYSNKQVGSVDCGNWIRVWDWLYPYESDLSFHNCSLDNEAAETEFIPFAPKVRGDPLKLPFAVNDNSELIGNYVLRAFIVNETPLENEWGEVQEYGKGSSSVQSDFSVKNKMVLDFGYVPSGDYSLYFFMRDNSNNLEILKKDNVEVVSGAPGVYVDWNFTSTEIDTKDPYTKKYQSDLEIHTHTVGGAELKCYTTLVDSSSVSVPGYDAINPTPEPLGESGSDWTVLVPRLADGVYTYRIKCKNDLGLFTNSYRVNYDETGNQTQADASGYAEIELVINSDRNMRFNPKVLTVKDGVGLRSVGVYTAIPSECRVLQAGSSEEVIPLKYGDFLDVDRFNSWGMEADRVSDLSSNPMIFKEGSLLLPMKHLYSFDVNTDDLDENVPYNYYIWCKHFMTNGETIYSAINELNKFVVYVDSQEPYVFFEDDYGQSVDVDKWMSSSSYDKLNIHCADPGNSGYEFGRSNTRENMTICYDGICVDGKNEFDMSQEFYSLRPFDMTYSCTDYYELGPKNVLIDTEQTIKIDNLQPTIDSFSLVAENLGGNVFKNTCDLPVLRSPVGNDVGYLAVGVNVNNFAISSLDELTSDISFGNFDLKSKVYLERLPGSNLEVNFRENGLGAYTVSIGNDVRLLVDGSAKAVVPNTVVNLSDGWHNFRLFVQDSKIQIYFDESLIIDETDSSFTSGSISFVQEGGYVLDSESFGIISEDFAAPLDADKSRYKIGSSGVLKSGLIKEDNSKLVLLLSSDELTNDVVNNVYFKVMDQATMWKESVFDQKGFQVVLDSKVPELNVNSLYTKTSTEGLGEPYYQVGKKGIDEYDMYVEYDLTTYAEVAYIDPEGCAGSGVNPDSVVSAVLTQSENGTEYWDRKIISHEYNETSGMLVLDLTKLTKTLGTKFVMLNVSDMVGNYKEYYYSVYVNDTMGPRFKMNITRKYDIVELSHDEVSPVLGAGLYDFCLFTNADDVNKDTFMIFPSLPYVALVDFDSDSMCGTFAVVGGTKYTRDQLPLPFEVVVYDFQGTQGGLTVKLNIDTTQPALARLVPPFEEYKSGMIDGQYDYPGYPVNKIRYGERDTDFTYIYTNETKMIVTGIAPKDTYLKYNDAAGIHDLHDYSIGNDAVVVKDVRFNISRPVEKGSSELYFGGEWSLMLNSLKNLNGGYIYVEFIRNDNEKLFLRDYPNYGKYYKITSINPNSTDGERLYGETRVLIEPPLDYDLSVGDEYKLYNLETISQLFRLDLNLTENGETLFYIVSLNDLQTETYMMPVYKIINDNVAPVIIEESVYPPIGTFNKEEANIEFNVTETISGIESSDVELYLNDVLVDNSRIFVEGQNPNYNVIYDPVEQIADGDYEVYIVVRDRSGNKDEYGYNFTMASGAPEFPMITIDKEVYNTGRGMIWVKDRELQVDVFFDDDLNVTLLDVVPQTGFDMQFSSSSDFWEAGRNRYKFNISLDSLSNDYVYEFVYRVKAFRTFVDGEVSPVGWYEFRVYYDLMPPDVRLHDEGLVRHFSPNATYPVGMDVRGENYGLRITIDAPTGLADSTGTFIIPSAERRQIEINESLVNFEFIGFDVAKLESLSQVSDWSSIFSGLIDNVFAKMINLEEIGLSYSYSEVFGSGVSSEDLALIVLNGKQHTVGLGNYTLDGYDVEVEDLFLSKDYEGQGAIKIKVKTPTANETVATKFWSWSQGVKLSDGYEVYLGLYKLPSELLQNRILPLIVNISDVAGNYVIKELNMVVDTQPPQYEVVNVTLINPSTNETRALSKRVYDELDNSGGTDLVNASWTSDEAVRIVAKMLTPDIKTVKAHNQVLDEYYTGVVDLRNNLFYVDIRLKGELNKKPQLNSIELNVSDGTEPKPYSDVSGLFVERDLLAPTLENIEVEYR
ncbi:carboxypeptidase regulatory-like domain-containing protein [Candidatus Woesearchaeota archaeon]|nr:carboxypeptidase regulatory-like domain-containing protein [Candidatus Woesearchaeota archaeon]